MKKTSNRLHSLFAALAALILAAALAVPAFAVEGGFADLYYRMNDRRRGSDRGRGQRAGGLHWRS